MDASTLQPFFDEAPAAWSVALAVVTLAGLVLWVAGGRLARAGVALGGFFLGGLIATSTAAALEPGGGWVVGIGTAGALAGTLLAFLLYRLWVGLLAGAILAAVVPVALLLWGVEPPAALRDDAAEPDRAAAVDAAEAESTSLFGIFDGEREDGEPGGVDGAVRDAAAEQAAEQAGELGGQLTADARAALGDFFETASAAWKAQIDQAQAAWAALSPGRKRIVLIGAAGGFVVGLLLGLALPDPTAAFQTALVGSCLLCGGTLLLLQRHAGLFRADAEAGLDPRVLLLAVGIVTLLGLLLQWTLARRRADA